MYRLTPSLAMVMLLEGTLMYHMSEGPLWKRLVGARKDSCVSNWWTNLLYISNYVNPYRIVSLLSVLSLLRFLKMISSV